MLIIQFGSKGVIGDSSSSQSGEKKTMGEQIFSRIGPHNRPHKFQITPRPNAPKFIIPKEEINIQLELATMAKNGINWMKIV